MSYRYVRFFTIILAAAFVCAVAWVSWGKTTGRSGIMQRLTDSTGAVVLLPAHPQRVVILNASNLDLYYGAGGTVVGRPLTSSLTPELAEKVEDIPAVGSVYQPSVEEIAAMQPDLVIGDDVPFHRSLRNSLAEEGIPLYINRLHTYDDVLQTLRFFGRLTGQEDTAAALEKTIAKEYAVVHDKAIGKKAPRTLILFGTREALQMATGRSFSGALLNEIGGGNIADAIQTEAPLVPLDEAYIAAADPEVILFINMVHDPAVVDSFRKDMTAGNIWQRLSAVRNGRVRFLPGDLFAVNPGSCIAKAMAVLYCRVYSTK